MTPQSAPSFRLGLLIAVQVGSISYVKFNTSITGLGS